MDKYQKSVPRENLIMLIMTASILLFNFIGFIVCYFIWREYSKDSDYIKENGKKLLNFNISFLIYMVVSTILMTLIIGIILMPIVSLSYFIISIFAMIKYGSYKDYNFPFTFNFIK